MSAFVLVRDNPYFTQPSGDGSFSIPNVPPGDYVLHAWHERSGEQEQEVVVSRVELSGLAIQLIADLSGQDTFRSRYTRPYARGGRAVIWLEGGGSGQSSAPTRSRSS